MPKINPHRRRRSRFGLLAMALVTLLMLGSGLVLTLWALGVPLAFWRQEQAAANPYLVRIPINVRPIAAYNKVDRADLIDPNSGWLKFQELPPRTAIGMSISGASLRGMAAEGKVADVRQHEGQLLFVLESGEEIPHSQINELGGALMNVSAIVGRVLKKDKTPGLGFREDNFFPRGTPEGIAGATPPGMRAIILEAGALKGVHTLPAGARVDLMANVPLDDLSSFDRGPNIRQTGAALVLSSSSNRGNRGDRTEPIMLAQEALVLKPVYQRVEATTSSSLTQGKRVQAVPVYEVALAVHPSDVIPLQSALNKELEVICVAHSMQPSENAGTPAPMDADGPVAPVTSRSILAYEVLTYDYFEDAATRRIRHEPLTEEEIDRLGVVTSLEQLVGAVVKHDIPKGSFITQADLLQTPQVDSRPADGPDNGTPREAAVARGAVRFAALRQATPDSAETNKREAAANDRGRRPNIIGEVPGISKFVPVGHKAVAIPWNRLYGAEHLQIGDVVDLTVSYSLQYEVESKEQERKPDGTVIERTIKRRANEPTERSYDETLGFRGEPWFAALDARVIGPVGYPPPAAATRFLGESLFKPSDSGGTKSRSGPPIVFSVDQRDQEAVSAALATKDATFAVVIHPARSATTSAAGWKRIVLAPEGISAFERLTSTDLEQGHTRRLLTRLVRIDDPLFESALTELELRPFFGRVLRFYKSRHSSFSAADFFPAGVQPGLAADIGDRSTVYVAADRDIEGLEHFRDNDRIAILFRGIVKRPEGVIAHGVDLERPIASVVVPEARILRASQEGKTVLEISDDDLARLHAAWAAAFAKEEGQDEERKNQRLHLVAVSLPSSMASDFTNAVVRPRTAVQTKSTSAAGIPDFDPASNVRVLQAIVGSRRETHVFAGDNNGVNDSTIPFHAAGR